HHGRVRHIRCFLQVRDRAADRGAAAGSPRWQASSLHPRHHVPRIASLHVDQQPHGPRPVRVDLDAHHQRLPCRQQVCQGPAAGASVRVQLRRHGDSHLFHAERGGPAGTRERRVHDILRHLDRLGHPLLRPRRVHCVGG
ncbi:unnamed protein product, partial [Ectocarpus sp. 8 AP-2014]